MAGFCGFLHMGIKEWIFEKFDIFLHFLFIFLDNFESNIKS